MPKRTIDEYSSEQRSSWACVVFNPADPGDWSVEWDALSEHKDLFKKCVLGKEVCPKTGNKHAHVVLELKVPESYDSITKFFDLVFPVHSSDAKQRWGKVQYNQKPHGFLQYAKKGGDYLQYDYRDGIKSDRKEVESRDEKARRIMNRCEEPGATMHDAWLVDPVFYFWHRRLISDYLHDMRCFNRGDKDGVVHGFNQV